MTETAINEKAASNKEQWRERIAEQERSGLSARRFCRQQGIAEHALYYWRRRLREQKQPMRFALVERGPARQESATEASLELMLATGERLRIGAGVDAITLRAVLSALRA
jgi:transposase-like protein